MSGVHFSLDAACASSLYAVKLACDYLLSGKADMMLAGAVSAADPLFIHVGFSIFQAYPEEGETSAPLDERSGGLVAGEGAGMFVLKRYTRRGPGRGPDPRRYPRDRAVQRRKGADPSSAPTRRGRSWPLKGPMPTQASTRRAYSTSNATQPAPPLGTKWNSIRWTPSSVGTKPHR